jgi:hypothetical protein
MQDFIKICGNSHELYKGRFAAGNWVEVRGLALQGQMIEIDMEARVRR